MQLNPGEQGWAPRESSSLICLLAPGQKPPATLDQFMYHQEKMLSRLIAEADEASVIEEERRLRDNLPFEVRMMLPPKPLRYKDAARKLLLDLSRLADSGTTLSDWRKAAAEAVQDPGPLADPAEAQEWLEDLDLSQYVESRLL